MQVLDIILERLPGEGEGSLLLALSENRNSHQSTIPSPTDVKRESVLGSMGRTCWQSGSFSRAVLIQFTKAYRSSSVMMTIYTHQLKAEYKQYNVTVSLIMTHFSGSHCLLWVSSKVNGAFTAEVQKIQFMTNVSSNRREERWLCVLPENECCVPSLDSSDVPPIARIPSFLLMTLRKVFAISLPLSSWTI